MKKSVELRQQLGAVLDSWKLAIEARDAEADATKRAAKNTDVVNLQKRHEDLKAEIASAEAFEAAEAEAAGRRSDNTPQARENKTPEEKFAQRFSMIRAIRNVSENKNLEGAELEAYQEATKEARAAQVSASGVIRVPSFLMRMDQLKGMEQRADLSVGTDTAGGYTVPTNIGELVPILQPKLVTRSLGAQFLTGLQGNLTLPRNNSDVSFAWEGENTDADQTDVAFDTVALTPKRLAAFTVIGKQLLFQSSIDVENLVRSRMNFGVQKAIDSAAINGSGSSNQPTGLLNISGVNSVALGTDGAVPTWANIIKLETEVAVDDADMGRLAYLTTPAIRGLLKGVEKASNTAQFVWTDDRVGDSRMGQLNGLNAFTSTLVPSTLSKGASTGVCHAIIFGNWEEMVIGQWAGLDITLDTITLAGKAQVKLIVNSWWDIAFKHAASFAIIKDAKLS